MHKRNRSSFTAAPTNCASDHDSPKIGAAKELAITTRQLQIARHVVGGKTAREIASDLALSRRTVESHIDALRTRLDCANRCQLTAKLVRLGVEPDE